LLEEKVHGTEAMEVFLNGSPSEHLSAARRCAAWLARFHASAPRVGNVVEPRDMVPGLAWWKDYIKGFGEPLASKAESLFRKLEAAVPTSGTDGFRAGHGSYIPEHVFLSGPRTVVIDLDEQDVADPARDLTWFVVSLRRLGLKQKGSLRVHDPAAEAFLGEYLKHADHGDVMGNLPFYMGAECLHRAHRDLSSRVPPVPEWAEMMLDEGLRSF